MSGLTESIIESVEKLYDDFAPLTRDEDKEQGRERFRVVLRLLDAAAPWPKEETELLECIRKGIRKALALFNRGLTENAYATLEQILDYVRTSRAN
jgi:hypothetical protein